MNRQIAGRRPVACPAAGFTLIELLITVVIISILAAMAFGALQAARARAYEDNTKALITKLHHIIMEHYDSYLTRRVPITTSILNPQAAARARVNGIRDLMRMEMPDRWSDVSNGSLCGLPIPALSRRYLRACQRAIARLQSQGYSPSEIASLIESHGAAELLYLIVMNSPDAADQFRESEIGDADGDTLMEFHDAWGNPVRFIRWPAGFVPTNDADTALQMANAVHNPDPFDPRGVMARFYGQLGYSLFPLIYSAGPDEIYDINVGWTTAGATYAYALDALGNIDPYAADMGGSGYQIGQPLNRPAGGGATSVSNLHHFDNIHNHRIEAR